ncbi:SCAN domain-containing protein 3-like [Odontesthes bonariensis]|uniref:SCAN domain-containing protein 3-like n=1 Tax=Odontesthes bonariensis TaxID=219752 RepID=UPI003F58AC77
MRFKLTRVENKAVLLVYVRYIYQDDLQEDLLCALNLPTKTTGEQIFKALDEYMSGKLSWLECVGVCTDGAAAMTGRISGFITRVKERAPHCEATHCVIHREALACKRLSPELNQVMKDVVVIINYVKTRALNTRMFEQLCDSMDEDHKRLLLHAEVRWLSRGKALNRVFELRQPLLVFLSERHSPLADHFKDHDWLSKLSYMCDIFAHCNELNLSLQGKTSTVFKVADKISAFKAKLDSWAKRVEKGVCDMFHTYTEFTGEDGCPHLRALILDHLRALSAEFERYFPSAKDPRVGKEWIRDPFTSETSSLPSAQEDKLLELKNDGGLKILFIQSSVSSFWVKVMGEFPGLAEIALKTLLSFPSTYLCEAGFSALTVTKTKQRSRLDAENTLRISLTDITPRYDHLVSGKQAQGSH